jgi:hypothetical protein
MFQKLMKSNRNRMQKKILLRKILAKVACILSKKLKIFKPLTIVRNKHLQLCLQQIYAQLFHPLKIILCTLNKITTIQKTTKSLQTIAKISKD